MAKDSWNWKHKERIPSDMNEGTRLIQSMLGQLEQHGWAEESFGVHLAVEEALVNAVRHGNRFDTSKRVDVDLRVSPDRVFVEIADEGEGFQPDELPDPTREENLEKPTGRGVMLMRNFMDRVEFNERGNQVTMEKRRP